MYVCIRRPLLVRGHQAAKDIVQITVSKSLKSFQSQVDSQVFHFQSAISSLPVWYQLLAVCRSAIWC